MDLSNMKNRNTQPLDCVFCNLLKNESRDFIVENHLAVAFYDAYPVKEGHTLVIPRRHISSLFEARDDEIVAIHQLLNHCRRILEKSVKAQGFNVGVNIGESAGQSVFHLHFHLIPRHDSDSANPLGGVRHVIPGKGHYSRLS